MILDKKNLPKHIAIIMDGNGRWAKSKKLPRLSGHNAGVKTVRRITEFINVAYIRKTNIIFYQTF